MAKKWIEGDDLSPDNLNRTGGYAEVVLPTMSLTEINAVLQAVASDGGGTVAFKNGLYEFAGDLVVPSNIGIIGESFGGTILQFTGDYGINGSGVFVYNTGTVSATKGSNQIVGSGTSWSANLTVGEEILIDGFYYEIASVVDDENLTITRPYPYESISDVSYVVANPTTSITITDFFITNTTPLNGYGIKLEYNKFSFLRRNAMIVVGEAYILKDCSVVGLNDTGINICNIGFKMTNAGSVAIQEVSGDCVTANFDLLNCKRCYASDVGAYSATKGLIIDGGYKLNFNSIWAGDNTTTGIEIKNSLEVNVMSSFIFGNTTGITIDGDCKDTKITSTSFDNTTNIIDTGLGTVVSGCTPDLMTGEIKAYAGDTAPIGWMICDGSAISRTIYSRLFAILGTKYGEGDGSTTFNIPNLKGRVPVGLDSAITDFNDRGKTGGSKTHTLTVAELAAHNHSGNGLAACDGYNAARQGTIYAGAGGSTNNTGGNQAHENMPPYVIVNYIIKT